MGYSDPAEQREYQRQWTARRRAKYAEGQSCSECGSTDRLQLDHINPLEKVSHRIWNWSIDRLEAELAKCQWLCHRCHRRKTTAQTYGQRRHGTSAMYQNARCRCDVCREWNRNARREYRHRKKMEARRKSA